MILDLISNVDCCKRQKDLGSIRLVGTDPKQVEFDGYLQICGMEGNAYKWIHLESDSEWDDHAATVACRDLGLSYSGTYPQRHCCSECNTYSGNVQVTLYLVV